MVAMFVGRVFSAFALCSLLIGVWYSVQLSRADIAFGRNNLESLRTAVSLAPGNATYRELLAEHMEAAGMNADSELQAATALSPHDSRFWIRRGFRAEVEEKYAEAERYLIQAHRVDRGFDPRWALMSFYFRRGNIPEFWKYTKEALAMSYGNLDPIFRLCGAVSEDPAATRKVLPEKRETLVAFFDYLTQNQSVQSASGVAAELSFDPRPEEVARLVAYTGRQFGHDNAAGLAVWNSLCRKRLLKFGELAPELGHIITNGDFSLEPLQQGFDWKYAVASGVAVGPIDAGQGLAIDLDGKQPETTDLIAQPIPLAPGKDYIIHYEYRLVGSQPDSGVQWVVRASQADKSSDAEFLAKSPVFSSTEWNKGQTMFSAGRQTAAMLALQYKRELGTVRWKGTAQIRHVTSELAAPVRQ
jgi:hypothetical protein